MKYTCTLYRAIFFIEKDVEIWEGNKGQVSALQSLIVGGLAVCQVEGYEFKNIKVWWYMLASMPRDRFPKLVIYGYVAY